MLKDRGNLGLCRVGGVVGGDGGGMEWVWVGGCFNMVWMDMVGLGCVG